MEANTKSTIDRRGRTITTFVVYDAATELENMAIGETLEILTDEVGAVRVRRRSVV